MLLFKDAILHTTYLNFLLPVIKDNITFVSQKLYETNDLVAQMKVELSALGPILKEKSEATNKLMEKLVKEQAQAMEVRQIVETDEAVAKVWTTRIIYQIILRVLYEGILDLFLMEKIGYYDNVFLWTRILCSLFLNWEG